jgi:hypothetical protein
LQEPPLLPLACQRRAWAPALSRCAPAARCDASPLPPAPEEAAAAQQRRRATLCRDARPLATQQPVAPRADDAASGPVRPALAQRTHTHACCARARRTAPAPSGAAMARVSTELQHRGACA